MSYVKLDKQIYFGINPEIVDPKLNKNTICINLTEKPVKVNYKTVHFPIPDRTAPSLDYLTKIIDTIKKYLNADKIVYIFCKGGNGRSGTIASSLYGDLHNLTGEEAMKHIKNEWSNQRDMSLLKPNIKKLGAPQTANHKAIVTEYLLSKNSSSSIYYKLFYEGEYSNFYPNTPFQAHNLTWTTAEAYFQAMKFNYDQPRAQEYFKLFALADSPMKIKMLGTQKKNTFHGKKWVLNKKLDRRLVNDLIDEYKDVKLRSDWEQIKIDVMIDAVLMKFLNDKKLKKDITSVPDNTYFVEHTTRDKIWADGGDNGSGKIGKNYLGKVLTVVSYVLKHGSCQGMLPELKAKIKF